MCLLAVHLLQCRSSLYLHPGNGLSLFVSISHGCNGLFYLAYSLPKEIIYIYIYIYEDGCCRSKERMRIYFKIERTTKIFVFFEYIYFVLTYVGYSMKLELTLVSSINDPWLVNFVYIGVVVLFSGVCLLWSFLPVFDIW